MTRPEFFHVLKTFKTVRHDLKPRIQPNATMAATQDGVLRWICTCCMCLIYNLARYKFMLIIMCSLEFIPRKILSAIDVLTHDSQLISINFNWWMTRSHAIVLLLNHVDVFRNLAKLYVNKWLNQCNVLLYESYECILRLEMVD